MIEIITMETIMKDYELSREDATRYLNMKGCPVLPRKKHQPYKVVREKFEEWLSSRVR